MFAVLSVLGGNFFLELLWMHRILLGMESHVCKRIIFIHDFWEEALQKFSPDNDIFIISTRYNISKANTTLVFNTIYNCSSEAVDKRTNFEQTFD